MLIFSFPGMLFIGASQNNHQRKFSSRSFSMFSSLHNSNCVVNDYFLLLQFSHYMMALRGYSALVFPNRLTSEFGNRNPYGNIEYIICCRKYLYKCRLVYWPNINILLGNKMFLFYKSLWFQTEECTCFLQGNE